MAPRRAPIFGPETWTELGGVTWSHWDRWYSAVCLTEADGDWSRLADVLADRRAHFGSDVEAKLSHLDDLAGRLDAAGLGPADLGGGLDKAELAKARRKVLDQGLSGRDLTPAMRHTPRRRRREPALRGSWAAFPLDPAAAYAALATTVEESGFVGKGGTFRFVRELEALIAAVVDDAADDPARLLAARRAALTAVQEAAQRANDSYGVVGELGQATWEACVDAPWRDLVTPQMYGGMWPGSSWPTTTPTCMARKGCRGGGHARPTCRSSSTACATSPRSTAGPAWGSTPPRLGSPSPTPMSPRPP